MPAEPIKDSVIAIDYATPSVPPNFEYIMLVRCGRIQLNSSLPLSSKTDPLQTILLSKSLTSDTSYPLYTMLTSKGLVFAILSALPLVTSAQRTTGEVADTPILEGRAALSETFYGVSIVLSLYHLNH